MSHFSVRSDQPPYQSWLTVRRRLRGVMLLRSQKSWQAMQSGHAITAQHEKISTITSYDRKGRAKTPTLHPAKMSITVLARWIRCARGPVDPVLPSEPTAALSFHLLLAPVDFHTVFRQFLQSTVETIHKSYSGTWYLIIRV